ncbi:hypothetical protein [Emticicia fluvialis]|uniref:hypothetical protein n=1 Tax=Emticicia fluvialis TaxID=2974474 RepID=UPI00216667BF|nr:hypothetical protein [Emticicia fluvialis]
MTDFRRYKKDKYSFVLIASDRGGDPLYSLLSREKLIYTPNELGDYQNKGYNFVHTDFRRYSINKYP